MNDDCTLKTNIYCKPTHTGQYLNWDSNHHLEHKRSVVHTRAETVVSEPEDLEEEVKHVKNVLRVNGYKKWSFQITKNKVREEDKNRGSYCQQAPSVHPKHLWTVRTTIEGT